MATHAARLIQDQNLNVHYNGAPKSNNVSKAPKKGGIGGRKALNDISNSGMPSALQLSKKHNSMDVISIGEDPCISKTAFSISKPTEKTQTCGRKALSDLTNSGKPSVQKILKKTEAKKKLIAVAEEHLPNAIGEEGFLHNHQECIKAQRKARDMDLEYFFKTVGLHADTSVKSASPWALPILSKSNVESNLNLLEMEEISEAMIDDRPPQNWKYEIPSEPNSPICGNARSPRFILKESPEKSFVL